MGTEAARDANVSLDKLTCTLRGFHRRRVIWMGDKLMNVDEKTKGVRHAVYEVKTDTPSDEVMAWS